MFMLMVVSLLQQDANDSVACKYQFGCTHKALPQSRLDHIPVSISNANWLQHAQRVL